MAHWKPKLAPTTDLLSLTLTNLEGFTVSRVDGNTTIAELALLTQQPAEQIAALLERLVAEKAILPDPGVPTVAPSPTVPPEVPRPPSSPPVDVGPEATPEENASHLKLYREQLHALPPDERARQAATAHGRMLSAFCFDPQPSVIQQILQNPLASFEQARLIAAHHPNAAGLEFLISRPDFARDAQVQRLLLRNPQLTEGQLRRVTNTRRLLELWRLTVSRDSTTQTRQGLVRILRSKFPTASAEERVELIFTSEGRVLTNLGGVPMDGHTTALLCARTYASIMLIQCLAHWAATPPSLIAHLLKQPMVMRQPRLKTMLHQHPNAPPASRI